MGYRGSVAVALVAWAVVPGCGRATKEVAAPEPLRFQVASAVTDEVTDYEEFPGRPHLAMVAEGWEEIAASIEAWLAGVLDPTPAAH